ncbi:MAG: alpha/beta fold hydrolase [Planctomycetota bacterium]
MRIAVRLGVSALVSIVWLGGQHSVVQAQGNRASSRKDAAETVKLPTKDGVMLKASYYPSSMGKDAVPIVLLHDYKESRAIFNGLARALQSPPNGQASSYAVLTVDLRGHGESTVAQTRNGQTVELEAARFGKQDFRSMVLYDMEAVRKFLVKQNDASRLNLNKLCLIGSGMGANVATSWAAVDWSAPQLASRKQGQDVKGLVLVSPDWSFRGLPLLKPLRQPGVRQAVSMMIVYGKEDNKATKSAMTVNKNLEKFHPDPPPELGPEAKELIVIGRPTSLQGSRLLTDPSFRLLPDVEFFLDARLVQQDYEWIQRRQSN